MSYLYPNYSGQQSSVLLIIDGTTGTGAKDLTGDVTRPQIFAADMLIWTLNFHR